MKQTYPLTFFFLLITAQLFAQENKIGKNIPTEIKSYRTQRLTTTPPVIDGKLDDACWQNNNWGGGFIQWIPSEGGKPSQPTFLNILYDDKNIYVAIRAYDSEPEKISIRAGRRDALLGDIVGINFDSYHDHRTGFEFNVSAAGQKTDQIVTNPWDADNSWDAVWTAKVGFEDSAWVVEYEIPLNQLRYSNETDQTWGMHVWRWIDRLQEESDWEPQTSTGPGMLYLFGHLEGISGLPKSRRIELMPYVLGKVSTFKKDAANPYEKDGYSPFGSIGLDAKIGLSSNFTADVTINPDFGQVESDPSEMNLSIYETLYEEKRPFFLEGKNIFNYEFDGMKLFYSRRIGQSPSFEPELSDAEHMKYPDNTSILSAVKISGKTANGFSMGILQSITNKEMALISDGTNERKEVVEPLTSYTVARLQKDFNNGNTVLGGIITSVNRLGSEPRFNFLNKNALTSGIDFLHQWRDKEFYLKASLTGSYIDGDSEAISILQTSSARYYQRPDADHLNYDKTRTNISGHGGRVQIGKGSKGFWRYSTAMSWQSPGLELNDLGFMYVSDQVKNTNDLIYFTTQPGKIFRSVNVEFMQINYWDFAFKYLYSQFTTAYYSQFNNKWSLNAHVCYFPKSLDIRMLRGGEAMKIPAKTHGNVSIGSDNSKKAYFSISAFYETGYKKFINNYSLNSSVTYQPVSALKLALSLSYSANQYELQYVDSMMRGLNASYFLGRIDQQTLGATFRIDYNINPELSIQYYGSPFVSIGSYSNFKLIDNPKAEKYEDRFQMLEPVLTPENEYVTSDGFNFKNRDFSFTQFRSNLVFRWEYLPGSKLYFVWSNERTMDLKVLNPKMSNAISGFGKAASNNIFLVKLSYWFSL
jgi:hypothetical protein